jgi:NCS1 family nucleobase:cation symporter-1
MTAQMGIFTLGASLAEEMPIPLAIAAVLIGNFAMVVVLALIGDIGVEHGINFAGYLRAAFGLVGNYLPLVLRAFSAIAWFGIQTYFAATAIEVVASEFFGIGAFAVWYVLVGALQILIVARGVGAIRRVVNIAAPALAVLSVWLLYLMFGEGSFGQFWDHEPAGEGALIVAIVANLSYWATVAINLPDFTRHVVTSGGAGFFSRNRVSVAAQLIGVPTGMLFFTSVGMAGYVFTGEANPVLAIADLLGGVYLIVALIVVVLAQISTNITANLYAAAYAANAIGAPRVSFAWGAVITGVLGLLTFPWVLIDVFLTFLPVVGAALAPVAGIMIADYYLIRRRRMAVRQLFDEHGQYRYWRGVNPAALIAWALGAALGILLLDYSFLVALPGALLAYYPLMRYWVVPRHDQVETHASGMEYLATTAGRDWHVRMRESGDESA